MDCADCSATNGRFAEDTNAILCPLEVIHPGLRTWIEEFNDLARLGIHCFDLVTLVSVADGAGKPEIGLVVAPSTGQGDDVRDLQPGHHKVLWAETVATAVAGCLTHTLVHIRWNRAAYHTPTTPKAGANRAQPRL